MRLNLRNRIQSFFYALFKKSLNFRMWFKHALKAQKLQKQHALKGQKLLAQGIALGMMAISKTPCKGKSFINGLVF